MGSAVRLPAPEPTPAKISRPRLAAVFARERLFAILDDAWSRPLIWITGPAGAGKTTLAASYLDARELSCLWYQVDEGDDDVATFFYYLSLAGEQASGGERTPLPLFSAQYSHGLSAFSRNFFARLFERLARPTVLVLDNYQEASVSSGLQQVLRAGTEAVPSDCHVLVVSRHDPPAAFARFAANNQMLVIGWQDLQLTEAEAQGIADLHADGVTKIPMPLDWLQRTQGWVAGLVLVMEWIRAEEAEPEALSAYSPETVFDYFASELLDKIEPEARLFLFKTALLPKMTEASVAALTGSAQAERVLAELNRRNFFVTRHTNGRRTYQYHPLFREFLLARGRERFSPDEIDQLRRSAADLLAAEEQVESAIELLAASHAWPRMAALIKAHAKALLGQGRGQTLAAWISALPQDLRTGDAWLSVWLGSALLGVSPRRSLPCFERAFAQFRQTKDAAGVYRAWCGAVQSICYDWGGSHKRWDRWIAVLDELLEDYPRYPSPEVELAVAQAINLPLQWRMPNHPRRAHWRERMCALTQTDGDLSTKVDTQARVLVGEIAHGELARARAALESLEDLLASGEPSPLAHTGALAWMALYYLATGELRECRACTSQGLEIAAGTGSHFYDYHLMFYSASAALIAGERKACAETLRKMSTMAESRAAFGAHFYHQLAAHYTMEQKDYARAQAHGQACLASARECGIPFFEAWGRIRLAEACFETAQRRAAKEHIHQALTVARASGSQWLEWSSLCARAYFALCESHEDRALDDLRAAFALGRTQGYKGITGRRAGVLIMLCKKALEARIEVDYARDLITTLGLVPDAPPLEVENWPWALEIYTLGRFQIVRDGAVLSFCGKAPKKPLRLLKLLVALGGRGINETQLVDALWSGEQGDGGHRAFTTTLHRLRKLLGEEVITMADGQVSLDPHRCWIDTWALEQLLDRIERKPLQADGEWASTAQRALHLYAGHFLAGEPQAPWSGTLRNRLRSRFSRATRALAGHLEQEGDWVSALGCYQRGIEVDDLAEELYQGLIHCHCQLGNRADALSTYHRCKRHLSITLGIAPSAATERAYRAIRSG